MGLFTRAGRLSVLRDIWSRPTKQEEQMDAAVVVDRRVPPAKRAKKGMPRYGLELAYRRPLWHGWGRHVKWYHTERARDSAAQAFERDGFYFVRGKVHR